MAMDEVPIPKEEPRQILADYDVDANDWWQFMQARVAESDQRKRIESRDARFAAARMERERRQNDIARCKQRKEELARRPQPELLAMLARLRARSILVAMSGTAAVERLRQILVGSVFVAGGVYPRRADV